MDIKQIEGSIQKNSPMGVVATVLSRAEDTDDPGRMVLTVSYQEDVKKETLVGNEPDAKACENANEKGTISNDEIVNQLKLRAKLEKEWIDSCQEHKKESNAEKMAQDTRTITDARKPRVNHDALWLQNLKARKEAPEADDWVVGSGEMHSVRDFLELVFDKINLNWQDYVEFDPRYLRPTEVDALCGDSTKIRTKLGWKPKYTFEQLVDEMIAYDFKLAEKEKL